LKKNISLDFKNKQFNIRYVACLIDSEGYANKEEFSLVIINTNKVVLENIPNFLSLIKINSSLSRRNFSARDKLVSYRLNLSVKFKNLSNLSIKVKRL